MQPFHFTQDAKALIDTLLDQSYQETATAVLKAVAQLGDSPALTARFSELRAEIERLTAQGETLTEDNAVLRALLGDLETTLRRQAAVIDGHAPVLEQSAIDAADRLSRLLSLGGMSDDQLKAIGMQWNTPDPNALRAAIDFAGKSAWGDEMDKFVSSIHEAAQGIAVSSIINGQSPLQGARDLRDTVDNLPLYYANSIMRTLQLTSYREANRAYGVVNADLFETQIRIAVLDSRTCLACIAQHGEEMALDERVDDHDQGRCTSIFIVKGRPYDIQSGEDWFNDQPPAVQEQMMGGAAYDAWKAGAITLDDFVQPYTSDVYGDMIREASLKGMLGDAAKQYYRR